jgi:hypothetical protein
MRSESSLGFLGLGNIGDLLVMREHHETRELGIADGCCWYSHTRANQFVLVHIFVRVTCVLVFSGDAGLLLLLGLVVGGTRVPGPSGRSLSSSGAPSLTFQVGQQMHLLVRGSEVSTVFVSSGMTSCMETEGQNETNTTKLN